MHINRLRLLGFKSFVEPTELVIEHGLTGVVGPNGCGKSNLLEALRWVMGETSHKSMRAAAMDDVIFSGTSARPARNVAEVTIFIDNRARSAPADFNKSDVIEITRRIEREQGSSYRVNGQDSRARDVKILFEDAATGARSPALVRQGQIAEIVNAKPEQRRRVLEDAAGVAGLHSRRHEAELRLKAAEVNLARLADILAQLGSQIDGLKRQARQVKRYKELSAEIRRAEAMLLHLHWAEAQAHVVAEEAALAQSLSVLGEATAVEAQALRQEAQIADTVQPLREDEARRAAAAARLRMEQTTLEREAERAVDRQQELDGRLGQLQTDLTRERNLIAEARQILQRLEGELAIVAAADAGAAEAARSHEADLLGAEQVLDAADKRLLDLTHRASELKTRRQNFESRLDEWRQQAGKVERRLTALELQLREVAARAPDAVKLVEVQELGQRLAHELVEVEAQAAAAEDEARTAAADARHKREAARVAELAARELSTELATLAKLLLPAHDVTYPPLVDLVQVAAGYEIALGAALGDDLDAPVAAEAAVHWRLIEPGSADGPLPAEAEPLIAKVEGAPELTRRLRQVGVVPRELGSRLQPVLKPGQRLVSREGDLWRWDGLVAAADAPTAAAQRLAERNRLKELRGRESAARDDAQARSAAADEAAERHRRSEDDERRLRQLWRDTQARLAKTRETLATIEKAARETESRMAALSEAKSAALDSLGEIRIQIDDSEAAIAAIDEMESAPEAELEAARQQARAAREHVSECRARLASAEREQQARAERAATAAAEQERWTARCSSAEEHIATLEARMTEAREELDELVHLLPLVEDKRRSLMDQVAAAERDQQDASDRVAVAETSLREAAKALKAAQAAVAAGREARARTEAKLEGARQRRAEEVAKIRDQLGVAPESSLELAEPKPGAPLPALADVDRHLSRLRGDRERLGGVNLQADEELSALVAQAESLEAERGDIEAGIAKLRGGIGQLNKEARKRLQKAFDDVNAHFQKLFTTLFGGGEARLEMVESEDPLESGLEIIAKPPGKKPATLSLLSGGEQTLTALSLIFAVFLTNPSPICVLDEVDAPLDDANVDRFCTLMEHMAKDTETRFLVITHHPMTMARMDRLFGVTMAEKGVSQLVSVDLATAEQFVEAQTG